MFFRDSACSPETISVPRTANGGVVATDILAIDTSVVVAICNSHIHIPC